MKLIFAWVLFPFFLVSSGILRAYQLFVALDKQTGFYKDGNVSNILLSASVALFLVIVWFINLKANNPEKSFAFRKNGGCAFLSVLAAIAVTYYSYFWLDKYFNGEGPQYDQYNGQIAVLILVIFSVLTLIPLLMMAVSYIAGRNLFAKAGGLGLFLPLWMIARIVVSFMFYTAKANIDHNFCDILSMCLILYVMYNISRALADIEHKKAVKSVFLCSIMAAVLVLISLITIVASNILSNDPTVGEYGQIPWPAYEFILADIAVVIFSLAFAAQHSRQKAPGQEEEDSSEEAAVEQALPANTLSAGAYPENVDVTDIAAKLETRD